MIDLNYELMEKSSSFFEGWFFPLTSHTHTGRYNKEWDLFDDEYKPETALSSLTWQIWILAHSMGFPVYKAPGIIVENNTGWYKLCKKISATPEEKYKTMYLVLANNYLAGNFIQTFNREEAAKELKETRERVNTE